jgi:hypothetical protein
MKLRLFTIVLSALIFSITCGAQSNQKTQTGKGLKITFVKNEPEKKIDVMVDGKLFTSYCWFDNVFKPFLYPINTSEGTEITRGYPLKPREGERNDHNHQIGLWLTYGDIDGIDFWGNGSKGLGIKNPNGGVIQHLKVDKMKDGDEGVLITRASWLDPSGKELFSDKTEYHFIAKGSVRIIDRIMTLTAVGKDTVTFKDTKEGMFGIRVARQLELPSKDKGTFIDAQGKPSPARISSNEGITGNYRSSEGITGDAVWSTRAKWMDLYGSIGNEKISIIICDHPKNQSYPTYWHARGYGLFSANPFGAKDFTQGKTVLNFKLPKGKSITLRYRVIVSSGADMNDAEINTYADEFAKKYK